MSSMNTNAITVGTQIAALRRQAGCTQEALAETLHVSPQAVSKWESGRALPELASLCAMAAFFGCSVDHLLFPAMGSIAGGHAFSYAFILRPAVPIAPYTGPQWPKSMAWAAMLSVTKLFFGLETRRDHQGRQLYDDREYILQGAVSSGCFGYSCLPDDTLSDSLSLYGLQCEQYPSHCCTQERLISLACSRIGSGFPVIVMPQEYTDVIFAVGFTDDGRTLIGTGFLEGDDDKNARADIQTPALYPGWYAAPCTLYLLKPAPALTEAEACLRAFKKGLGFLACRRALHPGQPEGYGLGIYTVWRRLLTAGDSQRADRLDSLFPHAFIHYEGKLRTRQFFELCMDAVPRLNKEELNMALRHYQEIVLLAQELAGIAAGRENLTAAQRQQAVTRSAEILRRSAELEELAIPHLQKALPQA